MYPVRKRAFTLIELLVVIAIIALVNGDFDAGTSACEEAGERGRLHGQPETVGFDLQNVHRR